MPLSAVRLVEEDEAASTSQDPAAGSIRVGCQIEFLQGDEDVDFFGCPGTSLHFDAGDSHTVDEIQGSWFTTRRWSDLWAPVSAVRLVAEGESEAAGEAAVSENSALQEPECGGYEEDWVDVERASALKCLICTEVARDALAPDPWDLC